MQAEVFIKDIILDNPDNIIRELKEGKNFKIKIFDSSDEENRVGVFIEHYNEEIECTIMFNLTCEQAKFLGNALISLSKNV